MLDVHNREHGYHEVLPPFIVNRPLFPPPASCPPKFEQDLFKLEQWDYFLIPTAEVPVTRFHRGEILDEDALPLLHRLHALFPVGGGLLRQGHAVRQHQFNKVELVKFCTPETSHAELERLLDGGAIW